MRLVLGRTDARTGCRIECGRGLRGEGLLCVSRVEGSRATVGRYMQPDQRTGSPGYPARDCLLWGSMCSVFAPMYNRREEASISCKYTSPLQEQAGPVVVEPGSECSTTHRLQLDSHYTTSTLFLRTAAEPGSRALSPVSTNERTISWRWKGNRSLLRGRVAGPVELICFDSIRFRRSSAITRTRIGGKQRRREHDEERTGRRERWL